MSLVRITGTRDEELGTRKNLEAKALAADFADERRLVSKAQGLWFKHKKTLSLV